MKGNPKVLERLNARLREELTAVNQYMVHSEMCANWGYNRLHDAIERRAVAEMKHAEKLIERILFFEGKPEVGQLNRINIGANVPAQIEKDLASEVDAVKAYNDDIKFAAEAGDNRTRDLLQSILEDEEEHVDWLETQQDQMEQMGVGQYLATQATQAKE